MLAIPYCQDTEIRSVQERRTFEMVGQGFQVNAIINIHDLIQLQKMGPSGKLLPPIHRCSAGRAAKPRKLARSRSSKRPSGRAPSGRGGSSLLLFTFIFGTLRYPNMAPAATDSAKIEEARKLGKTDPLKAEAIYKEILSRKPGASEAALREYETALMGLGESYRDTRKTEELAELVRSSTSSLSSFTKAKTAKLGT